MVYFLKKESRTSRNRTGKTLRIYTKIAGYLFSTVSMLLKSKQSTDTIDFEIRVTEGPLAYFNHITVVGNDKTNDRVIYRELRTKPGEKYNKELLIRTIREIGQLGFFDP